MKGKKKQILPPYFKPLLWSHDFGSMEPFEHKKTIILQAINYGDLRHWRWIVKTYGLATVNRTLRKSRAESLRPSVRPLVAVVFGTSYAS